MNLDTKYWNQAHDVVTRRIAGETVLVPVTSGAADLNFIYTANEVATMIWESLDGQKSVNQIVEFICSEYEVLSEEAAKDVIDFVAALEAAGLVRSDPDRGE
jgi:hypothetical protein